MAAVEASWRPLRTLGRGASGAVVSLAADAASGQLFAVKSAGAAAAAATLRREQGVMSGLCSPHVVRCIGGEAAAGGSYHLFLEYAPGGSLADEVARNGGRLEERAVRAYAADVLRGLAYLHGKSIAHGDVKPRNVVIGADGRAKLADFGCARLGGSARPIGGTPAFMAPEVARGEDQGPAADVWALGCTVVEMATGRAPWSGVDDDVLAAVHRIGYTDAAPEVPAWLSADAKHFLACCFARNAGDRPTAAQLLDHPFVTSACHEVKSSSEFKWVSPKSTLDAAFWESETDDDEEADEVSESPAERIKSLACSAATGLPEWDCDEGWIDVLGGEVEARGTSHVASCAPSKVSSAAAVPAGEAGVGGVVPGGDEQLETEEGMLLPFGAVVGAAAGRSSPVGRQENKRCFLSLKCHVLPVQSVHLINDEVDGIKLWLTTNFAVRLCLISHIYFFLFLRGENFPCPHYAFA